MINFITRSKFEGAQLNAQADYLARFFNFTAGVLSGANWDHGNFVFGYQYVEEGALTAAQRSFSANPDQTARAIAAGLPVGQVAGSATTSTPSPGRDRTAPSSLVRLNGAGNYFNVATGQQYSTSQTSATCNLSNENTLISRMKCATM